MFSGVRGDNACPRTSIFEDTWAWDGHVWTKLGTNNVPPGRAFAGFAYDPRARQAVLVGGGSFDPESQVTTPQQLDTWTWDGNDWHEYEAAPSPAGPPGPAFYDSTMQAVVALTDQASRWDGGAWIGLPGSLPAGMWQYAAAEDPRLHVVVLCGSVQQSSGTVAQTWTWNGTAWRQLHPIVAGCDGQGQIYMAYDAIPKKVVMLAGDTTFFFTGNGWQPQPTETHPLNRQFATMTFDAGIGRVVLFGGMIAAYDSSMKWQTRVTNELWSWDGRTWRQEP